MPSHGLVGHRTELPRNTSAPHASIDSSSNRSDLPHRNSADKHTSNPAAGRLTVAAHKVRRLPAASHSPRFYHAGTSGVGVHQVKKNICLFCFGCSSGFGVISISLGSYANLCVGWGQGLILGRRIHQSIDWAKFDRYSCTPC